MNVFSGKHYLAKQIWRATAAMLGLVIASNFNPAPAAAAPGNPYDFSFVWMSDTQYYSESYPEIYNAIANWTVLHQEDKNIKYVIHTGDIVNRWAEVTQWEKADLAMQVLEQGGVPYGILAGNHDVGDSGKSAVNYYKWFGTSRYKNSPVYGRSFENNHGHYDLVDAGGEKWIVLYMGWGIGDGELAWMNKTLAGHSDRKAILAFHEYLLADGNRSPVAEQIYQKVIVPNRNVFAVLCGHYHNAQLKVDELDDNKDGQKDRKVYQILADYQDAARGGQGFIRLLQFDMRNHQMFVQTYSPYLDRYNYYSPSKYPHKDDFVVDFKTGS